MSIAEQVLFESPRRPSPCDAWTCTLPLGYVDSNGLCHHEVVLRPITGREQQLLGSLPGDAPAAAIITALLSRCIERVGPFTQVDSSFVREMFAGDREFLVLQLRRMLFGEAFTVPLHCPTEACGEAMEAPLRIDQCSVEAPPVRDRWFTHQLAADPQQKLLVRLPTGGDQEDLVRDSDLPEETLLLRILRRCTRQQDWALLDTISAEEQQAIEQRMKQSVPQIEVEIEAGCPACGASFQTQIDVVLFALDEMRARDADLDLDIHFLASYYHWPESEILALTPRRRRRFIELVEQQLEGREA